MKKMKAVLYLRPSLEFQCLIEWREKPRMNKSMGGAYLGQGKIDLAQEVFQKCLEIKLDTGMAYLNLYRAYISRGKRKEALKAIAEARLLDPERATLLIKKMG